MTFRLEHSHLNRELEYFQIEDCYGGCQDWFLRPMMKLGGCGAATACDLCIYFDMYKGTKGLYPFSADRLTKSDYIKFSDIMRPYLSPRWSGIDRLDIYIDGFGAYLRDRGNTAITMEGFDGYRELKSAEAAIRGRIDAGFPIPCLTLHHKNVNMKDYEWHWYLLTGYSCFSDVFMVKAVTYGSWQWLDLDMLWNTGCERRGGLVLIDGI